VNGHSTTVEPLAQGFNLTDAAVTFDIPCDESIVARSDYIIVLMGDSGNASPMFTLERNETACAVNATLAGEGFRR